MWGPGRREQRCRGLEEMFLAWLRSSRRWVWLQQLLRKRHIGNDIVTIIFQEPGALPFTPKNIRSHFQHVFIIVRAHNPCTDNVCYRPGRIYPLLLGVTFPAALRQTSYQLQIPQNESFSFPGVASEAPELGLTGPVGVVCLSYSQNHQPVLGTRLQGPRGTSDGPGESRAKQGLPVEVGPTWEVELRAVMIASMVVIFGPLQLLLLLCHPSPRATVLTRGDLTLPLRCGGSLATALQLTFSRNSQLLAPNSLLPVLHPLPTALSLSSSSGSIQPLDPSFIFTSSERPSQILLVQHCGRLKQADHSGPGSRDQPGQCSKTSSLLKIQKLAGHGGTRPYLEAQAGELTEPGGVEAASLALSPRLECSGTISARITGAHHHAWLTFVFLVEMGFRHFGQAGLELLTSGDPPASASQSVGITASECVSSHCLNNLFLHSMAVTRSKDAPPFGPPIPSGTTFRKSDVFRDFLLAKVINAENAAHKSDKFHTMATRTRQEYLKDLAENCVSNTPIDSTGKFNLISLTSKKKEKTKARAGAEQHSTGAIAWRVVAQDYTQGVEIDCILGISNEFVVLLDLRTKEVVFNCYCGDVIGWTPDSSTLKIFYGRGDHIFLQATEGSVEDIREIVQRLKEFEAAVSCDHTRIPALATEQDPDSKKKFKCGQVWWLMAIIPALWEAEVGGSFQPCRPLGFHAHAREVSGLGAFLLPVPLWNTSLINHMARSLSSYRPLVTCRLVSRALLSKIVPPTLAWSTLPHFACFTTVCHALCYLFGAVSSAPRPASIWCTVAAE
ncbi:Signal-induced proliferation-associated 1-like protein 3 [Plecturocebus cupreus]